MDISQEENLRYT